MNINFLILGEYSQYVWPAFIFSFTICFSFYVKTQQKLKKLEIIFENEFKTNKNVGSSQQKDNVRAETLTSFAN